MARLESYLKRLISYKSTHPGPFRVPECSTARPIEVWKLFYDGSPVPAHFTSLPAPAFLVAAVIEALTHSHYRRITEMVPGEADGFCAARSRTCGGVVLSSDSDLLVTDLGSAGFVSLFKDLSLDTENGSQTVKTSLFKPKEIAEYLGLPDLLGLAFELTNDGTMSFHEAIRKAKVLTQTMDENASYQGFVRCYGSANDPENGLDPYLENKAESPLTDPRVSELILQYRRLALSREADAKAEISKFQPKIYLPFLLDDPARSSAWVASSSIRILAYSLLNLTTNVIKRPTYVAEYGRSGDRIVPKALRLFTSDECRTHCAALIGRLETAKNNFETSSSSAFWQLYGLYELCRWYRENDKPLPRADVLKEVLIAGRRGKSVFGWEDIHLTMQLQGVLYSLRIVLQIIAQLRVMRGAQTIHDSQELLYNQLCELPPLEELIPSRLHVSFEQQQEGYWDHSIYLLFGLIDDDFTDHRHTIYDRQIIGIAGQSEVNSTGSDALLRHEEFQPHKKRRKRAVSRASAKRNAPYPSSNNMYNVLDTS